MALSKVIRVSGNLEELNWCIEKANEGKGEYFNSWKKGFASAYRLQAIRLFELLLREGEIKEVK
jgi:hypothetical protein